MRDSTTFSRSILRHGTWVCTLGLVLGLGAESKAQWISPYGGIGWGTGYGFGAGYGYGGYGGYGGWGWGMPMADQWMMRYQMSALNAARYNLASARAANSYRAGALLRQQAFQTMLQNENDSTSRSYDSMDRYFNNLPTAARTSGHDERPAAVGEPQRQPSAGDIPFNKLVGRDGKILWPPSAPTTGDLADKKQDADEAISAVLQDLAQAPSVSVRKIVAARRALNEYAYPASQELRDRSPQDYSSWANWVSSLDQSLRDLDGIAGAPPQPRTATEQPKAAPAEGRGTELRPESSPESAGEALKEKVQESPE